MLPRSADPGRRRLRHATCSGNRLIFPRSSSRQGFIAMAAATLGKRTSVVRTRRGIWSTRERRSSWMHLGEGLLGLVASPLGLCALLIRATASQDPKFLRAHDCFSRRTVSAVLATFDQHLRTFSSAQIQRAQPTRVCCLGRSALVSVWTWVRRGGMRIEAWQTIDSDAEPERSSKEPHGLRIPCASFPEIRAASAASRNPKRYEPATRINLLLTLKVPPP